MTRGEDGPANETELEAKLPSLKSKVHNIQAPSANNPVKRDSSDPFFKDRLNRDEKATHKKTSWAITHGKGNIDEFEKSNKTQRKLKGKSINMTIDSSSEQTSVRTDLIKKTEINHNDTITTICYYGDGLMPVCLGTMLPMLRKKSTAKRPKKVPLIKKLYHIFFFCVLRYDQDEKKFVATYNTWTIGKLHYNKENKVSDIFFQRYLENLLSPARTILVSLLQIAAHLVRTYRTDGIAVSHYIMTARGQQQALK